MDDAIEKSTKGGFFNKPKYDKNGNIILKEKDFDKALKLLARAGYEILK